MLNSPEVFCPDAFQQRPPTRRFSGGQISPNMFYSERGLQGQWQGPTRQSQPHAALAALTAPAPQAFQEVQGKGGTGFTNDTTRSTRSGPGEAAYRSSAALPEPQPVSPTARVPSTAQSTSGDAGVVFRG